jgi:hypothetical protein
MTVRVARSHCPHRGRAVIERWMVWGAYSGGITVGEVAICLQYDWPFALACRAVARTACRVARAGSVTLISGRAV